MPNANKVDLAWVGWTVHSEFDVEFSDNLKTISLSFVTPLGTLALNLNDVFQEIEMRAGTIDVNLSSNPDLLNSDSWVFPWNVKFEETSLQWVEWNSTAIPPQFRKLQPTISLKRRVTPTTLTKQQVADIQSKFVVEVKTETSACESAFSHSIKFQEPPNQSLIHEMAGLSQLPTGLSDSVFDVTRIFDVPPNETLLTWCLPIELEIGAIKFSLDLNQSLAPKNMGASPPILIANYKPAAATRICTNGFFLALTPLNSGPLVMQSNAPPIAAKVGHAEQSQALKNEITLSQILNPFSCLGTAFKDVVLNAISPDLAITPNDDSLISLAKLITLEGIRGAIFAYLGIGIIRTFGSASSLKVDSVFSLTEKSKESDSIAEKIAKHLVGAPELDVNTNWIPSGFLTGGQDSLLGDVKGGNSRGETYLTGIKKLLEAFVAFQKRLTAVGVLMPTDKDYPEQYLACRLAASSYIEAAAGMFRALADILSSEGSAPFLARWLRLLWDFALPPVDELFEQRLIAKILSSRYASISMMRFFRSQVRVNQLIADELEALSNALINPDKNSGALTVNSIAARLLSAMYLPVVPSTLSLEAAVEKGLKAAIKVQIRQDSVVNPLPRDGGLSLTAIHTQVSAKQYMGHAIGLCSGLLEDPSNYKSFKANSKSAAWVTDRALQINTTAPIQPPVTNVRLHSSFGSSINAGQEVVALSYSGKSASIGEGDITENLAALDMVWPEKWLLPNLGFGLQYTALAAPLGNSGVIGAPALWDNGDPYVLSPAKNVFDNKALLANSPLFTYLSRVPPGTPAIEVTYPNGPLDAGSFAQEAYSESFSSFLQSTALVQKPLGSGNLGKSIGSSVIFLAPNEPEKPGEIDDGIWSIERVPQKVELQIKAPEADLEFALQWLEGEKVKLLLNAKPSMRDPFFAKVTAISYFDDLAEQLLKRENPCPFLGVREYLVVATIYSEKQKPMTITKRFGKVTPAKNSDKELNVIVDVPRIKVSSVEAKQAQQNYEAGLNKAAPEIALQTGAAIHLKVFPLMPEQFFNNPTAHSPEAKFHNISGLNLPTATIAGFRTFAAQEIWLEALPASKAYITSLESFQIAIQKRLKVLDCEESADLVLNDAPTALTAELSAISVCALSIEEHKWKWSGHPSNFYWESDKFLGPILAGDLKKWFSKFSGGECFIKSETATLTTSLNSSNDWNVGTDQPQRLSSVALGRQRGAQYIAFVCRPILRFSSLQKNGSRPKKLAVGFNAAIGQTLTARLPITRADFRLSIPRLAHSVSLTGSYESTNLFEQIRSANGVLLVFDEALKRTDSMAYSGGFTEYIDVDVLSTRVIGMSEVGPVATMHAAPQLMDASPHMNPPQAVGETPYLMTPYSPINIANEFLRNRPLNWSIEASPAFGLTDDIDRNAKVGQTALILHPRGNEIHRYWVHAKVRTRRIIEPSSVHGDKLPFDINGNIGSVTVPYRAVADELVPCDFAIISSVGFTLELAATKKLSVNPDGNKVCRYLCSWHKGQWQNTATQMWGLQIIQQTLQPSKIRFENEEPLSQWVVAAKRSEYENNSIAHLAEDIIKPIISIEKPDAYTTVRRMMLSDYGDHHWVTFIGTHFRERQLMNKEYWLQHRIEGEPVLQKSRMKIFRQSWNAEKQTKGYLLKSGYESIRYDLMIHPIPGDVDYVLSEPKDRQVINENTQFDLLFVFKPLKDSVHAGDESRTAQVHSIWKAIRNNSTGQYVEWQLERTFIPGDLSECFANLYRFQKTSDAEVNISKVLSQMFPAENGGDEQEVEIRMLPQFIEGIKIGSPPTLDDRPLPENTEYVRVSITKNKVETLADFALVPDQGWFHLGPKWNLDIPRNGQYEYIDWPKPNPNGEMNIYNGLSLKGSGDEQLFLLLGFDGSTDHSLAIEDNWDPDANSLCFWTKFDPVR
jgi:hypothetical protein